jgi:hypothetical protein
MPSQRSERSAAILLEVGELAGELVALAHSVAVAGATALEALSQRHLVELLRSRRVSISAPESAPHVLTWSAPANVLLGARHTYIPVLRPLCQVWVVYPAVSAHMLTRAHCHVLRRRDVYYGRLSRVRVRHPYCYRKAICSAAKRDRQRPAKGEQKSRCAILIG